MLKYPYGSPSDGFDVSLMHIIKIFAQQHLISHYYSLRIQIFHDAQILACRDAGGLVGPIRESELLATESLPECEAGCDINGMADMVDFVRQWSQVSTQATGAASSYLIQCTVPSSGHHQKCGNF